MGDPQCLNERPDRNVCQVGAGKPCRDRFSDANTEPRNAYVRFQRASPVIRPDRNRAVVVRDVDVDLSEVPRRVPRDPQRHIAIENGGPDARAERYRDQPRRSRRVRSGGSSGNSRGEVNRRREGVGHDCRWRQLGTCTTCVRQSAANKIVETDAHERGKIHRTGDLSAHRIDKPGYAKTDTRDLSRFGTRHGLCDRSNQLVGVGASVRIRLPNTHDPAAGKSGDLDRCSTDVKPENLAHGRSYGSAFEGRLEQGGAARR